jgi:hypothetical protein
MTKLTRRAASSSRRCCRAPDWGAAEALALLGTCTAARSVGGAASLRAIRAVAFVNNEGEEAVPRVCAVEPVFERPAYYEMMSALNAFLRRVPERSALPVVSGTVAKTVLSNDLFYDA